MNRQRECVDMSHMSEEEFIYLLNGDIRNSDYQYIDEEVVDFDTEKGFTTNRHILKRVTDGKYFAANLSRGTAGMRWADRKLEEVFPERITKTIFN